MRLPVVFQADAADDVLLAFRWYEDRDVGLGVEFLLALEQKIELIQDAPLAFQQVRGRIRRALVAHFPYGVFYVEHADRIDVIAVMHHARNPKRWRERGRPSGD